MELEEHLNILKHCQNQLLVIVYVCALGLPTWFTFADSSAIKYSIISRYFRLCHSLNGVN